MTAKFFACLASAAFAMAQPAPRYTVIDLSLLAKGGFSQANFVNENRLVGGVASLADGPQQGVLWGGPFLIDLGIPGLNSAVFGVNTSGQVALSAEVAAKDPNKENFCGYGSGLACVAALWQRGVLTALPTLGGVNASIGNINNRGEIAGVAETNARDNTCPGTLAPGGNGPQMLGYQAVVWGPKVGDLRVLKPLAEDTMSIALWVNDNGQAVGSSGTCATSSLPPITYGRHAVMWDADGTPHDLGNLGSTVINQALGINNAGTVIGVSALSDKATPGNGVHAFIWTSSGGMKDLGVLSGDAGTVGLGINEGGDAVGTSQDQDGNPRAFLWHDGTMFDLNELAVGPSNLYLLFAESINSRGEIAGFGATQDGDLHGFLAIPSSGTASGEAAPQIRLPESVRKTVRERLPAGWRGRR